MYKELDMECCGTEMQEMSRTDNTISFRCEECLKQRKDFIPKNLSKIDVKEWRSRCMKCHKLFIGNKRYCSAKCYYLENPRMEQK